jgi:hypothetical protein
VDDVPELISPSAILFFLQVNFVRFMLEPTPVQSALLPWFEKVLQKCEKQVSTNKGNFELLEPLGIRIVILKN